MLLALVNMNAEIMRGNPELAATIAPFWAQTLDFPGSDKFAQAMAAMAPPPVKAILQPEGSGQQVDPAAQAQKIDEMGKALEEAIQHAKDAQEDADAAIAGEADAKRLAEVRERELDIKAYEAETNRLKITGANEQQMQAIVTDMVNAMLSQPEPLPGDADDAPQPGAQPMQAEQPMAEPMEPEPMPEPVEQEPPQPAPPDPHVMALMDGHARLTDAVAHLARMTGQTRTRTAVRDANGDILHVTDRMDDLPQHEHPA